MSRNPKMIHRIFTVICVCALSILFISAPNDSFAADRHGRGYKNEGRPAPAARAARKFKQRHFVSPPIVRRGHVVQKLPRGYKRFWFGGSPYFYNFGIFYRSGPSGFVSVRAPIGIVVTSLPAGYRTVWVDGSTYYVYGGVFYRRASGGYIVVSEPETVIVEDADPEIVQPPYDASGQVSVTADVLNVRSGPGNNYPVIYQIHKGYILEKHGMQTGWLYVELPNGEFGWVMTKFTDRLDPDASG